MLSYLIKFIQVFMYNKRLIKANVFILMVMLLLPTHFISPASLLSSNTEPSRPSTYERPLPYSLQGLPSPEFLTSLESDQSKWYINSSFNQTVKGKLYNVTLITGDSVLVRVAENGTIFSIAVNPADPTKLGRNFLILKIRNSTYVIPSDIDIRRFDLELFNINLLIKEGYAELPYIPIIIEHSTNVKTLIGQLKARGGMLTYNFSIMPAFAERIPKDKAEEVNELLTSLQDVRKVWLDRKVYSNLNESAPLIGAPDTWNLGLNGSGVRIAIIDTGIDSSHADFFFPNGTSKIERAVSFVDYDYDGIPDEPPNDYFGHGTHVASIAAGTGAKSAGRFKGVAYGAKLWNVKVLNKWGWGYLSWVIAGVEYAALGPDYTPNSGDEADVLSLSLGAYWWTDGTDPLSMACDAAVDAGRAVVVAAGNWGDYFGIGVPATARKVITVGATDKQDRLAWFSSCGPTIDYRVKPDIVAPGVDLWAALAKGSEIEYWANQSWIPAIDVDGDGRYDYVRLSGTSMSTPHVSGAAALLKQLSPRLTPNEIKNVLISTAKDLGYNVYQQGGGRVNITSAIDPPVLVDPATISLGLITEDTLANSTITFTFKPLTAVPSGVENITLSLEATVREIFTGSVVDAARLNTTTITIPFNESRAVQLTINTTLPKSIYEGRVTAKVVGGPWENRTVHTILGFARLNNLTIMMINKEGSPAAYRPVLVFQHNATYYYWMFNIWLTFTDPNGTAHAYLPDGKFYVIGHDRDYSVQATVWTIAERVPIYGNTVVVLDERNAREVNFDPAKPNQVFCSKLTSVNYYQEGLYFWISWCSYWYYPRSPITYMTSTTLNATFGYQYYPAQYFNPSAPRVIDTPLWHNLLYAELGVTTPKTIVANYTELVKIVSDYEVGLTPRVGAYIWPYLVTTKFPSCPYSTVWLMNVPQSRVEYMPPNTWDWPWYWKYGDPPWVSTPYWFFEIWRIYPPSTEVHEKWGQHPFQTWLDGSESYLYGSVFADSSIIPHSFRNWWRYPAGHVKVWRNNTLIWEGDVDDYFWIYLGGQPYPSRFKIAVNGSSGQYLSTYSYYEYEFVRSGPSGYWFPRTPPVWIDDLDLNNTHAAGDVEGFIPVIPRIPFTLDDYRLLRNITLEYSVDDGATWRSVPLVPSNIILPVTIAGTSIIVPGYRFTLSNLSDAYVSLRVNATYTVDEIRQSQTIIRAFYVKPLVVITVGPPGSGAEYTSIGDAVRAALPYSEIRVLPGTYTENIMVVDKPLTIAAESSNVIVIGTIPFYITSTEVTIKGLTITGVIGIFTSKSDVRILGCSITGGNVGLLAIDSTVAMEGSEILHNDRDGLALYGASEASIVNCSLKYNRGAGVVAVQRSHISIFNSGVHNNMWGILLFDNSSLNVINATIYSNSFEGIAVLSNGNVMVRSAEIRDNYHGLTLRGFSNSAILEAQIVNNSEAGVVVADEASVSLNDTLVKGNAHGLVSYDWANIVAYNSTFIGGNEGVLAKRNSHISLMNCSITGNNIAGVLAIESSKVELIKSAVHNSSWACVAAYGESTINVTSSRISNAAWEAVIAWESASVTIADTTLTGSGRGVTAGINSTILILRTEIRDVRLEGLLAAGSAKAVINDTSISRSGISGISAYDSAKLSLNNITINTCGWASVALFHNASSRINYGNLTLSETNGVILFDNASISMNSSEVSLNTWGILAFRNSRVTLNDVVLSNNTWDGLVIWENSKVCITFSAIMFNRYGATAYHNATLIIHNSSIVNNIDFGVLCHGAVPVNATYNWWGDPSGPYHPTLNPNGTGDKVSDMVLFEPWLTSPPEQFSLLIRGLVEYANFLYGAGIVAKACMSSHVGIDPLDVETPPAPPEGLDMFFSVEGIKCLEDARPPATMIAWHFTIRTVNVEGTVTLTWDALSVPLKYTTITLIDEYTGMTVDMRTQTSYAFSLGAGESREFTIIAHRGG
jgi:subtilisin family serine protease